ncbi:MAG TPA: L,D-transpeptidase family protein [Flavobacterium sp.]|nr:L,D-transpeptidase family protein [Flavobacterium sp.]
MRKYFFLISLSLLLGCKNDKIPDKSSEEKVQKFDRDGKSIVFDSVTVTKKKDAVLTTFYRMHEFGTVWNKPEIRKKLTQLLIDSEEEGLNPEDYNVGKIQKLEQKANSLSDKEMVNYDILLTVSAQKYLWHLGNGKLNPKNLYRDWDLKPNKIDVNLLLSSGIHGDSLAKVMESVKPSHPIYKYLRLALQKIDSLPKDTIKTIAFKDKIYRNDTSNSIITIKKRLMFWKDMPQQDSLTKIYDKATFTAMKKFQLRHGLASDGVIGKGTIDALNFTRIKRRQQVVANLERWRWYPRNFGSHYIIVNIPGYYLRIIKDKDTIERKRVVVGKSERKTPILSSTFSNIVFNPTWTVPPTILKEDLLPAATASRAYFAAKEITIYNYKGDTVKPENWKPEKYKGYRYVQTPGYLNSLGVVKFNFPNHYSVYLHDTNHRNYFGKNYRSLSSGCVRVEDPLPMAQYMLDDSIHWSREKIDELIATKKTTSINLKQKIRLHQLYWTAWMEKNGDLEFRDDIYNLDEDLYKKLRD